MWRFRIILLIVAIEGGTSITPGLFSIDNFETGNVTSPGVMANAVINADPDTKFAAQTGSMFGGERDVFVSAESSSDAVYNGTSKILIVYAACSMSSDADVNTEWVLTWDGVDNGMAVDTISSLGSWSNACDGGGNASLSIDYKDQDICHEVEIILWTGSGQKSVIKRSPEYVISEQFCAALAGQVYFPLVEFAGADLTDIRAIQVKIDTVRQNIDALDVVLEQIGLCCCSSDGDCDDGNPMTNDACGAGCTCQYTPAPKPSPNPTPSITFDPIPNPTPSITFDPIPNPTPNLSENPSANPTVEPTQNPTVDPTQNPTLDPTTNPTVVPTPNSTVNPTQNPTLDPTQNPTQNPTVNPTQNPTVNPTLNPTVDPTLNPTLDLTQNPTVHPTLNPTLDPTQNPTLDPTQNPTVDPTQNPTLSPTVDPTLNPTVDPTLNPTADPTQNPTLDPTQNPTADPTQNPTMSPTVDPTQNPTLDPTHNPTVDPTMNPTVSPTMNPTLDPTQSPTLNPTVAPTQNPTLDPTQYPTVDPTQNPTQSPTVDPTLNPTVNPTQNPTLDPTMNPTVDPTQNSECTEDSDCPGTTCTVGMCVDECEYKDKCDDGRACTVDICDAVTGGCVNDFDPPCAPGLHLGVILSQLQVDVSGVCSPQTSLINDRPFWVCEIGSEVRYLFFAVDSDGTSGWVISDQDPTVTADVPILLEVVSSRNSDIVLLADDNPVIYDAVLMNDAFPEALSSAQWFLRKIGRNGFRKATIEVTEICQVLLVEEVESLAAKYASVGGSCHLIGNFNDLPEYECDTGMYCYYGVNLDLKLEGVSFSTTRYELEELSGYQLNINPTRDPLLRSGDFRDYEGVFKIHDDSSANYDAPQYSVQHILFSCGEFPNTLCVVNVSITGPFSPAHDYSGEFVPVRGSRNDGRYVYRRETTPPMPAVYLAFYCSKMQVTRCYWAFTETVPDLTDGYLVSYEADYQDIKKISDIDDWKLFPQMASGDWVYLASLTPEGYDIPWGYVEITCTARWIDPDCNIDIACDSSETSLICQVVEGIYEHHEGIYYNHISGLYLARVVHDTDTGFVIYTPTGTTTIFDPNNSELEAWVISSASFPQELGRDEWTFPPGDVHFYLTSRCMDVF